MPNTTLINGIAHNKTLTPHAAWQVGRLPKLQATNLMCFQDRRRSLALVISKAEQYPTKVPLPSYLVV
jgi:hypothetical protein